MEYGLLGEHLPHSFSKIIHEELGYYGYELNEQSLEGFKEFMQKKEFKGINITIPYKQTAIPFCDVIDEHAKKIGAINTVVNKNGVLYGYNTDYYGLKLLAINNDIDLKDKKVLILGNGGASKAAIAAAEDLGAKEIIKSDFNSGSGVVSYDEAIKLHNDAEIIINTTPVGMYPNNDNALIDLNDFKRVEGVIDVVYNPINTKLVLQAKSIGIKAAGGLYMLVGQAVKAADLFLGRDDIINQLNKVYNKLLQSKTNVVLIGMPASGKSTIAKELAKITGREVIDTDTLIVNKHGVISDIFSNFGEEHFRNLETEAVKEAAKFSGVIIATGGGAILREENVNALKQNGKFYFLNRPLNELLPTDDRPLASDKEKIINLYNKRINIYKSLADENISVTTDPTVAINQILKTLK